MLLRSLVLITLSGSSLVACVSPTHDTAPVIATDRDLQTGVVTMALERGADDSFGDVSATLGGTDLGTPTIALGDDGDAHHARSLGTATFIAPLSSVTGALDLSITEDGDVFHEVVPTYAAPRDIVLSTGFGLQPLRGGDAIDAASSVASDALYASYTLDDAAGVTCLHEEPRAPLPAGHLRFLLPDTLVPEARCSWQPGQLVHATLSIDIIPLPAITTCDGPEGVTCEPIALPAVHVERAVDVQL